MPWSFRRRWLLQAACIAGAARAVSLAAAGHDGPHWAMRPLEAQAISGSGGRAAPESSQQDLATVHVVYASDMASTTSLLAGMVSVARNLKDPEHCIIHLIVPPQRLANTRQLASCFQAELLRRNRTAPQVEVHVLKMHQIEISGRFAAPQHAIGITRLFLHEYLPDAPRAIWLDTDTIVTADLATLYRQPMEHAVAAVREGTPRSFRVLYWMQNWEQLHPYVPHPDQLIFNVGVMLFDLNKWKSAEMLSNVRHWASLLKSAGPQLLMNLACQVTGNFTELDPQWNVFGLGGPFPPRLEQAQEARILHWSGGDKPWSRHGGGGGSANLMSTPGALHKSGVRLRNWGHEQFDFLFMPYMPKRSCDEPAFVPML